MSGAIRPGLLLLHKRAGETSFSKVQEVTRAQPQGGQRLPVSHAGALDPFAEGLLILLVGPATRLMDALHVAPKRYVAEVAWGSETDSGDPGGKVVATGDPGGLTPERLEAALPAFLGWREQVPPATSNKRIEGERAYQKAHRGEAFELPPSRVYLHEARWLRHALPASSTLEILCGGGYYVRSLARDLGRAVGARAHLAGLHRTAIGPWSDPEEGKSVAVAGRELLPWCDSRELTDFEAGAVRQGGTIHRGQVVPAPWPLPPGFAEQPLPVRAFHKGRLVALLDADGERLRPGIWLRGL